MKPLIKTWKHVGVPRIWIGWSEWEKVLMTSYDLRFASYLSETCTFVPFHSASVWSLGAAKPWTCACGLSQGLGMRCWCWSGGHLGFTSYFRFKTSRQFPMKYGFQHVSTISMTKQCDSLCFTMRPFLNHMKAKQRREREQSEQSTETTPRRGVKQEPRNAGRRSRWGCTLCAMCGIFQWHSCGDDCMCSFHFFVTVLL